MMRLLVFSRTEGFRHDSIDAGVAALQQLAKSASAAADHTEDPAVFEPDSLARYAAVIWLQASGTGLLTAHQRKAYEDFTHAGGGFVGIHAAADAERDWPLFDALVGARFAAHPSRLQSARVIAEEREHPSIAPLPADWSWHEEWYAFKSNPRGTAKVLATVNEADYDPESSGMGSDHPICWTTEAGAGLGWYTALGHEAAAFADPLFRAHLWGGICSVARPSTDHTAFPSRRKP